MEPLSNNKSITSKFFYGFRKTFIQNEKLPLEARFLVILLMTYKGKNPVCWPSQGELAKRMKRNIDTVRKYLKVLQLKGYLEIKSRGWGRSLLYAPSYWQISAGKTEKIEDNAKPTETFSQTPTETPRHGSINSGNKENGIKSGKALFDEKRRELDLISRNSFVNQGI